MKKPAKRRTKGKNAAQLRIQTRDEFTNVYESRPDGEGFSWKMYGPFATADEQRAFMRNLCKAAPMTSEDDRTSILASIDAWVRFDEEEGYEPPAPEPPESAVVGPTTAEVHRCDPSCGSSDEDTTMHIKWMIDGIHNRPVTS